MAQELTVWAEERVGVKPLQIAKATQCAAGTISSLIAVFGRGHGAQIEHSTLPQIRHRL